MSSVQEHIDCPKCKWWGRAGQTLCDGRGNYKFPGLCPVCLTKVIVVKDESRPCECSECMKEDCADEVGPS